MAGSHMIAENVRRVVPYGKIRTVSILSELNDENTDFNYEVFFEVNPYSRFVLEASGETLDIVKEELNKQIEEVRGEVKEWKNSTFSLLNEMDEPEVEKIPRSELKGKTYSFAKVLEKDNIELFKGNVKEDLYSKYYIVIHLNEDEKVSIYATGTAEESAKNRLMKEIDKYLGYVEEDLDWTTEYLKEAK